VLWINCRFMGPLEQVFIRASLNYLTCFSANCLALEEQSAPETPQATGRTKARMMKWRIGKTPCHSGPGPTLM
jgi:hypothetical protein